MKKILLIIGTIFLTTLVFSDIMVPEISLQNTTKTIVINSLTDIMLTHGFRVNRIDDYKAVFDKEDKSFAGNFEAAFYEGNYSDYPVLRISYAIVQIDNNIRIIANLERVVNPETGHEKHYDDTIKPKQFQAVQGYLNELKGKVSK